MVGVSISENTVEDMRKRVLIFATACATVFAIAQAAATDGNVVAGGGVEIAEADALARIKAVAAARGLVGAPSESFVRDVAAAMYQTAAMANAAEARDLMSDRKVRQALDDARERILASAFLQAASQEIEVPDLRQAARDHYDSHLDDFRTPPRARVSHILLRFECDCVECDCIAERAQKAEKAKQLLERLRGGANFTLLAVESSEDKSTAGQGGSLAAWISPEEVAPQFAEAAFALKPGEISDIVETPFGYHIIRLDEKSPGDLTPFEEVEDKLLEQLEKEYRGRELAKVKASFAPDARQAQWNDEAVAGIVEEFASPETEEVPAIEELMTPVIQRGRQDAGKDSGEAN